MGGQKRKEPKEPFYEHPLVVLLGLASFFGAIGWTIAKLVGK